MVTNQIGFVFNDADEIVATVRMTNPGDPGRSSGPPEDCYQGWGPEFEVTGWTYNGNTIDAETILSLTGLTRCEVDDAVLVDADGWDWADEQDPDFLYDRQRDEQDEDARWLE